MEKLLLLIFCLSTATISAMEQDLQISNQNGPAFDIASPSLGNDIIDTLGNSGLIVIEPNSNPPEDNLFTAMRAIVEAREERIVQQQKRERLANIALAVGCSGLFLMIWPALQNIF